MLKKHYKSQYHHIRMISEGSCETEDWCWKFSFCVTCKNYTL